jgi:hypothetical protein
MANGEKKMGGSDGVGEIDPPLSRAEELMQAYPNISVIQSIFFGIEIFQTFSDKWRYLKVDVEHEYSQQHYPNVIVKAFDYPMGHSITDDVVMNIRRHALTTLVKVHVENGEHVTPEVGYEERQAYMPELRSGHIKFIEEYSSPIPAQELVATAKTGLEMLKAYREASPRQRRRIDWTLTGIHGWSQIADDTKPDMDEHIAEASPLLGNVMKHEGISYTHVGLRSIYALNALKKVTDTMLPSKMPPAPQNRRELSRRRNSS